MATPRAPTLGGGRFVLDSRLGEGGQAAVFRARDLRLGVERALKILLPRFAAKTKVRARFAAEARAMAQLEHRNIVRVYDVETEGSLPYLVMELVPSGSLANWLESYGAFPTRQAVDVALQICAGASGAHASNIVHRDIKPQNVLVAQDGSCKLTDFGIARFEDSNRTRMGASLGTEGYMAPEQAKDASSVDVRSDVYGIAMTLYVLASGNDPVEWISGRGVDAVPAPLREVIARATSRDPAGRYASADALAQALREITAELPPDAHRLPLGDSLPVRSIDTGDAPESYVDVSAILDPTLADEGPPRPERSVRPPSVGLPDLGTLGPPPPAVNTGSPPPPPPPDPSRASRSSSKESTETPSYVDREPLQKGDAKTFLLASEPLDLHSLEPRSESAEGRITQVFRGAILFVPVVIGCLLLAVAYGAWENITARRAVEDMEQSRAQMYRELDREREVIAAVVGLGADVTVLDAAYRAFLAERGEPERSAAAVRFVEQLQAEADRVAKPGTVSWEEVNGQVRRLLNVRDRFAENREEAAASTESRWVIGAGEPVASSSP